MKIAFEGRWRIEDLKDAICNALDALEDDQLAPFTGVVWVSGANLYLTPEDSRKEPYLMALLNGAPETFHYPNPQKSENRKRSGRSDSGKKKNNIITLSDYRTRKPEKL